MLGLWAAGCWAQACQVGWRWWAGALGCLWLAGEACHRHQAAHRLPRGLW